MPYSQTIDRLQADSIIWPNRWVRICTSYNRILKRCCCWLRIISRLSLSNTLTDQLLCLHFILPPPNFLGGITFSQLGHRGIDARTMALNCNTRLCMCRLTFLPLSAVITTGPSRTVLDRIVLVAERRGKMKHSSFKHSPMKRPCKIFYTKLG